MDQSPGKPSLQTNPVLNVLLSLAFGYIWFFVLAKPGWWQGWLFLAGSVLYLPILVIRLYRLDPILFKERGQRAENVPAWDRRISASEVAPVVLEDEPGDGHRQHGQTDVDDPRAHRETERDDRQGEAEHERPPAPRAEEAHLRIPVVHVRVETVLRQLPAL